MSRLGFGCYRVDDETPDHREALIQALQGGCSLIDTSTNYMDGSSERMVGSVLAELEKDGRLSGKKSSSSPRSDTSRARTSTSPRSARRPASRSPRW